MLKVHVFVVFRIIECILVANPKKLLYLQDVGQSCLLVASALVNSTLFVRLRLAYMVLKVIRLEQYARYSRTTMHSTRYIIIKTVRSLQR